MATEHQTPQAGTSCQCCWDDIDTSNYCEYQAAAGEPWLPSGYCTNCVQQLLDTQWEGYVTALAKTTCKAEQRRLLTRGPPINLRDPKALPCPNDGEIYSLWYSVDQLEHSPKLVGSLEGEARKKFLDEQLSFYIKDEADDPEEKEPK